MQHHSANITVHHCAWSDRDDVVRVIVSMELQILISTHFDLVMGEKKVIEGNFMNFERPP